MKFSFPALVLFIWFSHFFGVPQKVLWRPYWPSEALQTSVKIKLPLIFSLRPELGREGWIFWNKRSALKYEIKCFSKKIVIGWIVNFDHLLFFLAMILTFSWVTLSWCFSMLCLSTQCCVWACATCDLFHLGLWYVHVCHVQFHRCNCLHMLA